MLRKRIGVMVPSTNTTLEADFQLLAPRQVTIHGQRLWLTNEANGDEAYARMNAEIESGARYLATARVDVVAYGCTTGSFYRGPGWDREMLATIQSAAGVPAVATSPAVTEALLEFPAQHAGEIVEADRRRAEVDHAHDRVALAGLELGKAVVEGLQMLGVLDRLMHTAGFGGIREPGCGDGCPDPWHGAAS